MKDQYIDTNEYGKFYYKDREKTIPHREDGPAIELSNGNKYWALDGKLHREGAPAVEFSNGDRYWYIDNKLHREDGPAVEYSDGGEKWYIDGEELTEEEFNARRKPVQEGLGFDRTLEEIAERVLISSR